MTVTREDILDALGRVVTRGVKLMALADDLGLKKSDYAVLRSLLAQLIGDGTVQILPGGAFALPPAGRSADKKARPAAGPPWRNDAEAAGPRRERKTQLPSPASRERTEGPPRRERKTLLPPTAVEASARKSPERTAQAEPARKFTRRSTLAGRFDAPPPESDQPVGRITVHPAGYGFVALSDGRDAFVPAKYRGGSLDGDQVRLSTWVGVKGLEGRVDAVIARGRARLTGLVRRAGRTWMLEPDDPRIAADFGQVALDDGSAVAEGRAVVVEITRYPSVRGDELAGRVLKVLGDPDDPRTEVEKILACAALPSEFPAEAARQAEDTAQEVGVADLVDRIDLRDRRFCTIDPETARDFDDALCIEDAPGGGTRVWVAVADVSHYVRWDDPLDRESTLRGVSVYLPDRVIPMLPHQLSSGICSLNPEVDRCAMVVRLDYDEHAQLVDTNYAAAVIRSQARLDYPGVAAALQGDFRGRREAYRPWAGELARLAALAQRLREQRRARGTLDLDLPEAKVVLDADDPRLIRDVIRAKGDADVKGAYQLVEEYMIAANEAVGRFFRKRGAATVWRVHAPPKRERVEELSEILGSLGIEVDVDDAMTPLGMKGVLDRVAETQASRSLSFLVLRSLKQAVWDTVPIGHFGLASGDYVHFTSPIRRYPDLLVHRLLKYWLHRDGLPAGAGYRDRPPPLERLTELAALSSAHERRAMEAEREAVAMYRAYLMRDQIGERFTGTVSAVTSFGAFVEIDRPFVEGLIKIQSLGDDIGYDELHLRLRARRSGFTLTMGDQVEVEVVDVSVARRRIELKLVIGADRGAKPDRSTRPVAAGKPRREPERLEFEPRAGLDRKLKTGRAVAKANPKAGKSNGKASKSGRPTLKVSHRGRRR